MSRKPEHNPIEHTDAGRITPKDRADFKPAADIIAVHNEIGNDLYSAVELLERLESYPDQTEKHQEVTKAIADKIFILSDTFKTVFPNIESYATDETSKAGLKKGLADIRKLAHNLSNGLEITPTHYSVADLEQEHTDKYLPKAKEVTEQQLDAEIDQDTSAMSFPWLKKKLLKRQVKKELAKTAVESSVVGTSDEDRIKYRQQANDYLTTLPSNKKLPELQKQMRETKQLLTSVLDAFLILKGEEGQYTNSQTIQAEQLLLAVQALVNEDNLTNQRNYQTAKKELSEALDFTKKTRELILSFENILLKWKKETADLEKMLNGLKSVIEDKKDLLDGIIINKFKELLLTMEEVSVTYKENENNFRVRIAKLKDATTQTADSKVINEAEGLLHIAKSGNLEDMYGSVFRAKIDEAKKLLFAISEQLKLNIARDSKALGGDSGIKKLSVSSDREEVAGSEAVLEVKSKLEGSIEKQMEVAKGILGRENVLGPKEVEQTFGVQLKDIPDIPFSKKELERAEDLNQFLILRVDKAPDGSPLTMKKMNELQQSKFKKDDKGKVLYDTNWYQKEEFYTTDTPKVSWALVSKENIPNSTSKNYLQQTQDLVRYVSEDVFKGTAVPKEYQEAIKEFENYLKQNFQGKSDTQIQQLLGGSDWQKYAQELGDLKINQITRQSPTEALYDILVYFQNNKRLLEKKYTWTKRRSSVGGLVFVGDFGAGGASVDSGLPVDSNGNLGVSFSRSL